MQHAILEGQRINELPKDHEGLTVAQSVCGKIIHGPVSGLDPEHVETMRCRVCKGFLRNGRRGFAYLLHGC